MHDSGNRRRPESLGLRQQVGPTRRLSQRISEGDGIAIIVRVSDVAFRTCRAGAGREGDRGQTV